MSCRNRYSPGMLGLAFVWLELENCEWRWHCLDLEQFLLLKRCDPDTWLTCEQNHICSVLIVGLPVSTYQIRAEGPPDGVQNLNCTPEYHRFSIENNACLGQPVWHPSLSEMWRDCLLGRMEASWIWNFHPKTRRWCSLGYFHRRRFAKIHS